MRFLRAIAVAIMVAVVCSPADAAFITTYDFTGTNGTQAFQAPAVTATGVMGLNLTRGPGLGIASPGVDHFNANGWTNSAVLDLSDYYQFGFTVGPNRYVDLSTIVYSERRSGTGPTAFSLQYSLDGSTFTQLAAYSIPANNVNTLRRTFNVDGVAALDYLTGTVTFRLYGFAATNANGGGTHRLGIAIGANPTNAPPTLELTGQAVAVPEPSSLALLGLGLAGVIGWQRRKPRDAGRVSSGSSAR